MRRFTFLMVLLLLVIVSCRKGQFTQIPSVHDLNVIFTSAECDALKYFQDISASSPLIETKSSDDFCSTGLVVPDWAYPYIEMTLSEDDIAQWDHDVFVNKLRNDYSLSTEQKEYIAYVGGVLGFIIDDALTVLQETKGLSNADCLAIYKQQVVEILTTDISVGAIGGGVVGGVIGVELGIIGGLITSWREIKQAGREYIRCTS